MVRWPAAEKMSRVSAGIVERFQKTAGAKELEQDAREWVLVNWPWLPEAPYSFVARASDGEERQWVGDADGRWVMRVIRPAAKEPHRAA
jgi:hypothetical protein